MPDFDFDTSNSDLQIGLEVEWPRLGNDDELFVDRGRRSRALQSEVPAHLPGMSHTRNDWDGTVGMEIVTDPPLPLADVENWYRDVLEVVRAEFDADYQPCGLMNSGSTAGCHVHLSPLSRGQAEALFRMSQTPWMKVLFCSSIARDDNDSVTWPVFRGGQYCAMEMGDHGPGQAHYQCVNYRGGDHWEWRLPEPMIPENISVLVEFLRAFEQSPEAAQEYAQRVLDDADDRITSIRRAESIGMDIEDVPSVRREQPECDPEHFYETVESEWYYPEIYTLEYNGDTFYLFESRLEGTFEVAGVQFSSNDILYADSLNAVDDSELHDTVRRAYRRRGEDMRETEATEELKKIVKKK